MLRMAERKKNNAEMSRKKKRDRTPKRTETLIEEIFLLTGGGNHGEEQAEIDRKRKNSGRAG